VPFPPSPIPRSATAAEIAAAAAGKAAAAPASVGAATATRSTAAEAAKTTAGATPLRYSCPRRPRRKLDSTMKPITNRIMITPKGIPPPLPAALRLCTLSNFAAAASTLALASSGEARSCAITASVPASIAPAMSPDCVSLGIIFSRIIVPAKASVRIGSRL
jgi:hypothetical protein